MGLNKEYSMMSPELMFVLSCAKYSIEEKDNIYAFLTQDLNWNLVLQLSLAHRLSPLVYNTIISLEKSRVPVYVIATLREHYIINVLKVTSQNEEIIRIVKTLNQYGIQPIILKGPPLSIKINEDITHRPSNDIDMFVDPLEFDKTEKILLQQMGYTRSSPDFQLSPCQQKHFFKIHHHFEYYHSQRAISVELHWKIRSFNIKNFPTAANLSTQRVYISECPIAVMDNEHWLLFLMIHGYKHFWDRLRWLYDIKEFMKLQIDWKKTIALADMYELRVVLNQSLILVNQLFDVPIPDCLKQSLTADKKALKLVKIVMNKQICNKSNLNSKYVNPIKDFFVNYNYSNYTLKNKLNHLMVLAKPSLEEFRAVSLPDIFFPCYYILRPFYRLGRQINQSYFAQKKQ